MLHARIQLLRSYLTSLPSSYLTAPVESNGTRTNKAPSSYETQINHPILRSIQALVNRLPLLTPSDGVAFESESLSEKSDVTLVGLLGDLTRGTKNIREMGRKFGVVSDAKQRSRRGGMGMGMGMRSIGPAYEDTDDLLVGGQTMGMGQPYE